MGRTPSSPPQGFSEHEVPTRVRATIPWSPLEEAVGDGGAYASRERAMGESVDTKTTAVPVDMLEAALAESRVPEVREEKSGARKKAVPREEFSVHEADTKRASTIEVRKAAASMSTEGKEVDALLAATHEPTAGDHEALAAPVAAPKRTRALPKVLATALLLGLAAVGAVTAVGHGSPAAGLRVVRAKIAAR